MNFAAVYHRSTPDMCYSPDGNENVINIREGRGVDTIYVVQEEPEYNQQKRKREV